LNADTNKGNAAPAETVQAKNQRREAEIALAMKQEAERRGEEYVSPSGVASVTHLPRSCKDREMRDVRGMPKKSIQKKPVQWDVYRLKGSPAAFVGVVYAPDEKAALKVAIREFDITPEQQNRLLIRRA
jgi:hypothetical protein